MTTPDKTWDVGEPRSFRLDYADQAGAPTNPGSIIATVRKPDGTTENFSAGVNATTTVGLYTAVYTADAPGRYVFRFVSTGAVAVIREETLYAKAAYADPDQASETSVALLREFTDESLPTVYSDVVLASRILRTGSVTAAASEIWRAKAGRYAQLVNVGNAGDNQALGDLQAHALVMADRYAALATAEATGGSVVTAQRPRTRAIVRI